MSSSPNNFLIIQWPLITQSYENWDEKKKKRIIIYNDNDWLTII